MMSDDPTRDLLMRRLTYEPATGCLRWFDADVHPRGFNVTLRGQLAGCLSGQGYIRVGLGGKSFAAHRIAWIMQRGPIPDGCEIDHRNLQTSENNIENLRLCIHGQNQANAPRRKDRTLPKGVSILRGRYRAQIGADKKKIHIGMFDDPAEAHAAYMRVAVELFGEFARAE